MNSRLGLRPVRAAAQRASIWLNEHWPRVLAIGLFVAALLPLAGRTAGPQPGGHRSGEWPQAIDGAPLRPLALSAVEQRFAQRFPGRIGRFDAGDAIWVLRDVNGPTRMLHPASDCFRGLGYRIEATRLEHDAQSRLWRCFVAEHRGERLRVCERIVDADAQAFTDTSAWFWAAALGQSTGPWRALTRVEAL
jgi:hypothetical protein